MSSNPSNYPTGGQPPPVGPVAASTSVSLSSPSNMRSGSHPSPGQRPTPAPRARGSFAAIAAGAAGSASTPVTSTPSSRRASVPTSPSPRVHRANGSGTFQWGVTNTSTMPALPSSSSPFAPGLPLGAGNGALGNGQPFFPRPPYLEHTAFRHLFEREIFTRNSQPTSTSLSSSSSSSKPLESGRLSGTPVRSSTLAQRMSAGYSATYMLSHPGSSTPSPINSDGEELDQHPSLRRKDESHAYVKKLSIIPDKESFTLPTRWNDADRHASVQITPDGRGLTFLGQTANHGPEKEEAASARANCPIPPACGVYYYEVEILNKGNKGHIGVGFATKNPGFDKLPGWTAESWGYHGDDGNRFHGGNEDSYGPRFSTGDVVGCGVDFSKNRIFFTKNGVMLGPVAPDISPTMELYPFVGLRSSREQVQTNFGQHPFRFDIEAFVLKTHNEAWSDIQSTQLMWKINDLGVELRAEPTVALSTAMNGAVNGASTSNGTQISSASYSLPAIPSVSSHFREAYLSVLAGGGTYEELSSPSASIRAPEPITVVGSESSGGNAHDAIRELVLEYLVQAGYPNAAKALKEQCDADVISASQAGKEVDEADEKRLGHRPPIRNPLGSRIEPNGSTRMDTSSPLSSEIRLIGGRANFEDSATRRRITDAIRRGDIDTALADLEAHYPDVVKDGPTPEKRAGGLSEKALNGDGDKAGIKFKLRCRKLVEMALEATSDSKPKNTSPTRMNVLRRPSDAMDIDGAAPSCLTFKQQQKQKAKSQQDVDSSASAFEGVVAYGQTLHADYGQDKREKVQSLLKNSSSLFAWVDPTNPSIVGEDTARFVGQEARDQLAKEVNEVILESQNRKVDSTLERVYRQTAGVVRQLGVQGEGAAAFADVDREFLSTR